MTPLLLPPFGFPGFLYPPFPIMVQTPVEDERLKKLVASMADSKAACNAAFLAIWSIRNFEKPEEVADYCLKAGDSVISNIRTLIAEDGNKCLHLLFASQVLKCIDAYLKNSK